MNRQQIALNLPLPDGFTADSITLAQWIAFLERRLEDTPTRLWIEHTGPKSKVVLSAQVFP